MGGAYPGRIFVDHKEEPIDEWINAVDESLKDCGVIRVGRHKFELDAERFKEHDGWQGRIPEGYEVGKIDPSLAKDMPGYALEYWRSIEDFLSGGFGFCVTKGDDMVSVCRTMPVGEGIALNLRHL